VIRGQEIVLRPIRWGRFSQLLGWATLLTALWIVSSCGGGGKEPYRIVLAGSDGIYSVGVHGAGLARLSDVPDDRLPSLSPDASRVVWVCGEGDYSYDICISNLDGTDQRNLTDGRVPLRRPWRFGPVWLRDGSRVAFFAYDNYVHFVNVDGTGLTRVYEKVYGPLTVGALSSDGKRILDQRQADARFEVFVTDLEDTGEVKIADIAGPFYPLQAWSPEGDKVVFLDDDQRTLHIADMQTGTLDSVSVDTQIDLDVVPAWSPDGSCLAFAAQELPAFAAQGLPGSSIFTVNADGTDLKRIADADLVPRMGPPHSAVMWSPDGQQVFYLGHSEMCAAGGCTPGFLYVVNSDGTGEVRLTDALAYGILGFQGQPE
jgi:Tol biopolymer transport system component